jgi:hypothetical protein
VITETRFTEGLTTLQNNISQVSGLTLEEYKRIVRARLLSKKLQEMIAGETVAETEEAVHARHILLRVREPEPTPTVVPEGVTPEPTLTPTPLPEGFPTPAPTPGPRDDAATLALANELRQRLVDGEDLRPLPPSTVTIRAAPPMAAIWAGLARDKWWRLSRKLRSAWPSARSANQSRAISAIT